MSPNRRIFLNIVATYGRSLYALAIGLLSGRWVLMSLGEVDYGLCGVVGGMVGFVAFMNGLMAGSVSRFYAFSVGAEETNKDTGLEECRKWFNTALLIHTVLPIVLIIIGYPCGVWAVRHYLTIPADRVDACIWVWRFVSVSCFVGMVNVPFQGMYTAKQEIAELTIYSFFTTTFNFVFVWYMVTHPGVWLTKYAGWTCALSVIPQIIITIRACIKYPECCFNRHYLWDRKRMIDILNYSGGRFICALSLMLSNHGGGILVNKMLGPTKNAAMSIGSTVAGHCSTLSNSFIGAYSPAITNAAGAGDLDRMRKLMFVTCTSASAAILAFSLPLCLEIDEVMVLWLKNPPKESGALCLCLLLITLLDRMSDGLWMGIFAIGKVFAFQLWESILWFAVLPMAYVFVKLDVGVVGFGLALVASKFLAVILKLVFGRRICGFSIWGWIFKVAMPIVGISIVSLSAGLITRASMLPSFWRVVCTTASVEVIFLPLCWFLLLNRDVRDKIKIRMANMISRGRT